ncbi:hypothetical protein OAE48_05015 [Flavobacteriales bacterium]|nr:hypothetical protein [Flavobacteriales bacterium]
MIEFTKNWKLITETWDIERLFDDYAVEDDSIPLEIQIENVLRWAYDNDKLETFLFEFLDDFIEADIMKFVKGCDLEFRHSMLVCQSYSLYSFESKNKVCYFIKESGMMPDMIDTQGAYDGDFEEECEYVFTNFGEFDRKQLLKDGHTIEFYT